MISHQSLPFPHQSLVPDPDFQLCPHFLLIFHFYTEDIFFDQVRYNNLHKTVCILSMQFYVSLYLQMILWIMRESTNFLHLFEKSEIKRYIWLQRKSFTTSLNSPSIFILIHNNLTHAVAVPEYLSLNFSFAC